MTIKSVFRVQCDGPCKGWLSWSEDYVPGTDMLPRHHVVEPTAVRALNWPGERAARLAALQAGWVWRHMGFDWLCPKDAANPLGIVVPSLVRFIVTGDPVREGIPYAVQDVIDGMPKHVREQVERDVRAKFAELWPGVEITKETWHPLYVAEGDDS